MPQIEFLDIISDAAGAALALFVAVSLSLDRQAWRDHRAPLAAFFYLNAVLDGMDFVSMTGAFDRIPWINVIPVLFSYFFAPLMLSYIRALTATGGPVRPAFRRGDMVHAIPFAVASVAMVPVLLLPPELQQILVGNMTIEIEIDLDKPPDALLIAGLSIFLCVIGFLVQVLVYLFLCYRLLFRHAVRVRDLFSNIENKTLNWLRYLLLMLSLYWILQIGQIGLGFAGFGEVGEIVNLVYAPILIFVLGVLGLRQEAIFVARSVRVPVTATRPSQIDAAKQTPALSDGAEPRAGELAAEVSATRMVVTEDAAARIARKLQGAMSDLRLYADPSLSLRDLSDATRVSEHHLSEVLNRHLNCNFYDFVNGWRVRAAQAAFDADSEVSIMTVMLECGFNARSTFNTAFKKATGLTPTEYRRQTGSARPAT